MPKALIVDDNAQNLYLLEVLLKTHGFEVNAARNGAEALHSALADPPDIILSDVLMPVMDGFALCRRCQEEEALREIPFVFYTATFTDPKDEEFGLSLGAARYIIKPQEPDAFMGIVAEVLAEHEALKRRARQEKIDLGPEVNGRYGAALFRKLEKRTADLESLNVELTDSLERLKKTQRALEESENNYRHIYENISEGMYRTTPEGRYLSLNPAFARMFGYSTPEEMMAEVTDIGRQLYVDPQRRELLKRLLNERGEVRNFEAQVYRRDGSKFWISINARAVRDEKGRVLYYDGTNTDITARVEAMEELRRAEASYRSLFENAQEGIFRSTPEGRVFLANRAMAQILGYDSPEDLMEHLTDVTRQLYVNPEDRAKILKIIEEKGMVRGYEVLQRRKDGTPVWISLTMHAVRDETGRILYYEGLDEDITERKLSEERMKRALMAAVEAMVAAVETRDPHTAGHQRRVAVLACAIAEEMGLPAERVEGLRMAALIHDLGKISVPAELLTMPRTLTKVEFALVKTHAQAGHNILKDIDFPWPIARMILEHHERLDGSGYPQGLKDGEMLEESRILAVADVVESMASHRPYRAALGIDAALAEIEDKAGVLYDPQIVAACLRLFRERGFRLPD
ncbi:MAG TPA: PAS domain S-box protein [Syntrophales bacterium]|nr:PAS domain S-box protein [Syntrophales bacterium]